MILCTVGTHDQGFNRLVEPMDQLAAHIEEKVIIQFGASTYFPQHAEHFKFTTSQHMEHLTREARVVVAHAAAGTILVALRIGKPLVVVPRLQRFGEVYDDHQLQLAGALESQGRVIVVADPSAAVLRNAITQVIPRVNLNNETERLIKALQGQLGVWSEAGKVYS